MPVYALLVEKGAFRFAPGRTLTADTTLTHLADVLSDQVDWPVIDMTEMKGSFHMALEWTPDENPSSPAPGAESPVGPTIFTELHEVGLRLQGRKAPIEILVVDRAEKIPVEN